MATFGPSDDLRGAEFSGADLSGARFVECDLSGFVMRGVEARGAEIDSPWLPDGGGSLLVNGVDVVPFVEAELDRRFPGRGQRRAREPEGLCAAWAAVERAWAAAVDRVAAMPPATEDVSVGGEWSFAQTLRHLVMATDAWLGRSVLEAEQPFHPLGLPWDGAGEEDGFDGSVLLAGPAPYADVDPMIMSNVVTPRCPRLLMILKEGRRAGRSGSASECFASPPSSGGPPTR